MFDALPQILQNVRYANGSPLDRADVQTAIDDGRRRLGNQGRLLIRPSGTEPLIRVMGEGEDESLVHEIVGEIAQTIERAAV